MTVANCNPLDELQIYGLDHLSDKKLLQLTDYLSFDDLIILASTDARMKHYIKKRYILGKYHLQSYPIRISVTRGFELIAHGNRKITTANGILQFLRLYGAHIPAIHIHSTDATNPSFREIGRYIERYCRATVTELRFQNEATALLDQWSQPFDRVFYLKIEFDEPIQRLKELFPSMSWLNIELANAELSQSEHLEFPELTDLHYHENVFNANKTFLANVLQSNPQLRRLHLYNAIDSEMMTSISTISLDQLETLEMRTPELTTESIAFIGQKQQLTALSLPRSSITYTQLNHIIEKLNNLNELHIRLTSKLTSNELNNILCRANQLENVTIDFGIDVIAADEFAENHLFDKRWTIVDQSIYTIRLVRNK